MEVFDDVGSMYIRVDEKDLRLDGERFGAPSDNCYVPIFRSSAEFVDVWQVGSIFTKQYYLVYDMTPYDERREDFIQIGFGLQNETAEVMQARYNYSSMVY